MEALIPGLIQEGNHNNTEKTEWCSEKEAPQASQSLYKLVRISILSDKFMQNMVWYAM